MRFNKYIASGNDFIAFKNIDIVGLDYNNLAKRVCNRRFGIGADGILVAGTSDIADIKMLYYNSDGSQGEMCGNGIRAFSKFIFEEGLVNGKEIKIETLDGIKHVKLEVKGDKVKNIEVNMGKAVLKSSEIPIITDNNMVVNEKIIINKKEYIYSAVRIGVPHVVIFLEKVDEDLININGFKIENHSNFPEKTNVNFVEIVDRKHIKIYTWERGAGRTLGCGTGSCSAVFLGNYLNKLDNYVYVETEGGDLEVKVGSDIYMKGRASLIAKGDYYNKEEF